MNLKLISDVIHDNLDIVKPPTALQHTTVSLAPGSVSSIHQAFTAHWPSLISSCTFRLVSVASVSTGLFKPDYKMKPGQSISWIADRSSSVKKKPISDWECMEHTLTWISLRNRPIANLSLCVPPSLSPSPLSLHCPPPSPPHRPTPQLIGQGGESGTGASSYEQSFGRGLGPQADPRPLYRDLCAGHRQHAAQPGLSGPGPGVQAGLPALGPRCDHLPPRGGGTTSSSSPSSPWGDPRQDATPIPGPWQQHVAPAPPAQQHQPQRHHAVQTQGTQRGALPAEPWQDTHANVLPGSLRRTHTRSHWGHPQYIDIRSEG